MIAEDYVSVETSKLLKEKGFDAECHMIYTADGKLLYTSVKHHNMYAVTNKYLEYYTDIIAPTLQMAMKWLREVHNIHIVIKSVIRTYGDTEYYYELYGTKNKSLCVVCDIYKGESWDSSEEATEAAIKYCLENLI